MIDPPTKSNILAMEAPSYGAGRYTRRQIEYVLSTALTGYSAAVYESKLNTAPDVQVAIHTGFWGCGAYGGNRELMPLLQMIAACGSDVATMIFHSGPDSAGYDKALEMLERLLPLNLEVNLDELLLQIDPWGLNGASVTGTNGNTRAFGTRVRLGSSD